VRPPVFAVIFLFVYTLAIVGISPANGQINANCVYYKNEILPTSGCGINSSPTPLPSSASRMTAPNCADALIYAVASLLAYDAYACHPVGSSSPVGNHNLKFIADVADFLTPNWRRILAQTSNSRGSLWCDADSNILILAFPGTAFVFDDVAEDIIEHIGPRPKQYEFAQDAADAVAQRLSDGHFDRTCGPSRPILVLTGHSKGGGQAQFAAALEQLKAVVFNSDIVNPVIADDSLIESGATGAQFIESVYGCATGRFSVAVKTYVDYLSRGMITDIRMANDPLTKILVSLCHGHLPHAPVRWLVDALSCSSSAIAGHAIETVIRELRACAP
jgi:hypothetical protein